MKTTLRFLLLFLLSLANTTLSAQVSDEIKDIVKKCQEKINNPQGVEMDMETKILMIKMHIKTISKGDKMFMSTSVKALGKSMTMEMGYDGVQGWAYDSDADTLVITKTMEKPDEEIGFDFGMVSKYKTAKMKVKNGLYEITFTNPINKKEPGKAVMKINQSNYYPSEIQIGSGLKSATMKITKIKVGNINDKVFVLDLKKYPTAKVVRK